MDERAERRVVAPADRRQPRDQRRVVRVGRRAHGGGLGRRRAEHGDRARRAAVRAAPPRREVAAEEALAPDLANRMAWNGMEWNGMEWNGMEWNGMEWNGTEWNAMSCTVI